MINCHGGWSKFRVVEAEDVKVFKEAAKGLMGVDYEPLLVATQIVNGTNYQFICNATTVTNPPRDFLADVSIYKPLCGEAVITHIDEL